MKRMWMGSALAPANGGLSTSRIGFRGTEDLGGGLRAGFWLEGSPNPDTGTGRTSNTSNTSNHTGGATTAGPLTFDCISDVSLSRATLDEVRLGRDFIPTHDDSIYLSGGVAPTGGARSSGWEPGVRHLF